MDCTCNQNQKLYKFTAAWTTAGCYFQPQAQHENIATSYSRTSNCRGIDSGKALINPRLLQAHRPSPYSHRQQSAQGQVPVLQMGWLKQLSNLSDLIKATTSLHCSLVGQPWPSQTEEGSGTAQLLELFVSPKILWNMKIQILWPQHDHYMQV